MSNSPSWNPPINIKVLSGRPVYEAELPPKLVKSKSRHFRENPKPSEVISNSQPTMSAQSLDELDPLCIGSLRDLEDVFRDMTPFFEGKESEHNWSRREKSILKLRRMTKGNTPQDFTVAYLAGIRSLLDGILKTVNSLRTTVSTNGCLLIQEIAKASGTGLDGMVEILLQSLIKLCANTKKITAANGDATVNAVVAHVTYNVRLAQHMWGACQDKNVQPRSYATGWLKTIITKHRHHKNVLEHAGSLELIEKCIKLGLTDRDPKVRESMRPTFWAFARLWSERSEGIVSSLEPKQQKLLLEDSANPRPRREPEASATLPGVKPSAFSKSTSSLPLKPSIRETIAAQKKAKMNGNHLPERPGSAEPSATPMKPVAHPSVARPATAMSTIGSLLSSAPVRPMRPARRPEMKRPVTADPPVPRKPAKLSPSKSAEMEKSPSAYKRSPQPSPVKKVDTYPKRTPDLPHDKRFDAITSRMKDITVKDSKDHPLSSETTMGADFPSAGGNASPPEEVFKSEKPQRISMTPRAIVSKKENPIAKLKVYEDPVGRGSESPLPSETAASRPSVLEELPINEPPILSTNYPLLAEEGDSPHYHRKWINIETSARRMSDSDKTDNPYLMRRMLESGIARIKAGTLDAHGFRKLQALIRGRGDIWEDGVKFDELLLPLLENLESPSSNDSRNGAGRAHDLKTQVLVTVRLMQQYQPKHFSVHYSRALCAIILARRHHNSTSHIVCGLEETSETIVAQCDPLPSLDAVLDLLEAEPHEDSDTLFMSLYVLAGLLHRISSLNSSSSSSSPLSSSSSSPSGPDPRQEEGRGSTSMTSSHQNARLGNVAASCLRNTNPDVRRAVVEFILELHDAVGDNERFWALIDGVGEDHRSLITYYLARREKAYSRLGSNSSLTLGSNANSNGEGSGRGLEMGMGMGSGRVIS